MFSFDIEKLNYEVVQLAMGQAFFSIGAGVGFIMTYGAYLPKDASIGKSALTIIAEDVGAALLVGVAIYSIVFGINFPVDEDPA